MATVSSNYNLGIRRLLNCRRCIRYGHYAGNGFIGSQWKQLSACQTTIPGDRPHWIMRKRTHSIASRDLCASRLLATYKCSWDMLVHIRYNSTVENMAVWILQNAIQLYESYDSSKCQSLLYRTQYDVSKHFLIVWDLIVFTSIMCHLHSWGYQTENWGHRHSS